MTETPQIQALIQEIDEVLRKTSPRLPWVMSTDSLQQRQLLEQTRQYLASLQQEAAESSKNQDQQLTTYTAPAAAPAADAPAETAQQVLQAVLQEMNYLRLNLLQPLRSDVELLQRQREGLIQEIRQLESQRQHALSPAAANQQLLVDFFQSAMGQMQENLKGQVAQMLASLSAQAPQAPPLLESAESRSEAEVDSAALSPVQRLEHLQMVQAQSDYLLMRLDSTLRVVFESLQNNLQSYQDSLEQGLNRMYHLGQQGEAMFATLVNRLAEQLGREASVYLKSSLEAGWTGDRPPTPGNELVSPEAANPEQAQLFEDRGTQTPAEAAQTASIASGDRWQPPEPIPPDPNQAALDALSLELNQLDLSSIPPESLDFAPEAAPLFQGDRPLLEEEESIAPEEAATAKPPVDDDLESALDLLNQVATEDRESLEEQPSEPLPPEIELVAAPDQLYNDEFYQSLFGSDSALPEAAESEAAGESAPASADEDDWFISGLADLGQPSADTSAEERSPEEFPAPELSQSGEHRLLGQPDLPQLNSELTLLPEETDQEQPMAPAIEAGEAEHPVDTALSSDPLVETLDVEAETITSLTELIPAAASAPSEPNSPPPAAEIASASEESYEVAQPHENLLASDDALIETIPELSLPDDALQQLTTDLSRLEAGTAEPIASVEPELPASAPEGNPLDAASLEPAGATAQPESNPDAESLLFTDEFSAPIPDGSDSLEGLFSLIPAEPNVTSEAAKTTPSSGPVESGPIEIDSSTRLHELGSASDAVTAAPADANSDIDELNAFTLEGLESLFEGVPAVESEPPIADRPADELPPDAPVPPLDTEQNLDSESRLASEAIAEEPSDESIEELEKKKF